MFDNDETSYENDAENEESFESSPNIQPVISSVMHVPEEPNPHMKTEQREEMEVFHGLFDIILQNLELCGRK